MFGEPVDDGTWRLVNFAAVVPLLGAAILPIVGLPMWHRRRWRRVLLNVAWVIAMGCVMQPCWSFGSPGQQDDPGRRLPAARSSQRCPS